MMAAMMLSAEQFPMKTETSPKSLRGPDAPRDRRLHGELRRADGNARAVHRQVRRADDRGADADGRDEFMQTAADRGLLYADYDIKTGASLDYRVGRHLAGAAEIIKQMGEFYPGEDDRRHLADLRRGDGEGRRARSCTTRRRRTRRAGVQELGVKGLGVRGSAASDSPLSRLAQGKPGLIGTGLEDRHEKAFAVDRVAADGGGRAAVGAGARRVHHPGRRPEGDGRRLGRHHPQRRLERGRLPAAHRARGRTGPRARSARSSPTPTRARAATSSATMPQVAPHLPLLHVALLVHEREGRGDCRVHLRHRHDAPTSARRSRT